MVDFEKNNDFYKKMHQNIISVLEKKEFTLFLSTRNNL
jgi:hypothetical protein